MRTFEFGQYTIRSSEVFFLSKYTLGLVNLKPIAPGHVLLLPRRKVERVHEMTGEELADLMQSVQTVGRVVEREFQGTSLTIAMQDGRDAGQSVYHVHMHVIPRRKGDWSNNDDIYPELEKSEKDLKDGYPPPPPGGTPAPHGSPQNEVKKSGVDFEDRKPRTLDEMAKEAQWLRTFFPGFNNVDE